VVIRTACIGKYSQVRSLNIGQCFIDASSLNCVIVRVQACHTITWDSNQEVQYLSGENYGDDENCVPQGSLKNKILNIDNIVKSFKMALHNKPYSIPESCHVCGKLVNNLKKHMKSHNPEQHKCPLCPIILTRADNLKRHLRMKHCSVLKSNNISNIQTQC
jgi:hypothetical protein